MKTILLFFIALGSFISSHAQPGNRMGDDSNQRVKAMYIAYMTEQLNLDENTAQTFWPIQKQMHKELNGVRDMKSISVLDREEAMLNVKKKYKDRFIKILGEERTNLFFAKDQEFRRYMVEHLQKRKMGAGRRGPGPDRGLPPRP